MLTASDIVTKYTTFFEKRGHKRIQNASLVPFNDPTTLFTSSGMQQLVPYLLGETHPQGKRLVNVQNCFRAQDIEEIGDNRHTTFFRMLGNWSLGDYFKKEQLPWFFEFLTHKEEGLGLDPKKLYVTVFAGNNEIGKDTDSITIWKEIFVGVGIDAKEGERIFPYDAKKNWWSRAGVPENMPAGEPGGPDSEVFYDFGTPHNPAFGEKCHVNCDCGRYVEIGNSVFMQYIKQQDGLFQELPQKNVDFGGGLERLLAASDHQSDVFKTNLLAPIITAIETATGKSYAEHARHMRIITDHFIAASFIAKDGVMPSNKEQGYILRRLIRRGLDNVYQLEGKEVSAILETIASQYGATDPALPEAFETVTNTILEEQQRYNQTLHGARKYIEKKYPSVISGQVHGERVGDELKGETKISADDAFVLYTTHGLSPTQIKSLGYIFDDQEFAEKMEAHQKLSREGAKQKFAGGLADHQERTIMGHTATHLMHQALRDVLGDHVHQTGSNITTERVRFDFNYDKKLTDEDIKQVEDIVNDKIKQNLPVHFEIMPLKRAKDLGAIGLFDDKYAENVKIYFIGSKEDSDPKEKEASYSIEFCGGPHVDFTEKIKRFKIIKQENLGKGQRRIYAIVGN